MINIDENYPIRQANEAKMKISKFFPKSRDQKYWKIPSRKIPGLKFLIPLGPADESIY